MPRALPAKEAAEALKEATPPAACKPIAAANNAAAGCDMGQSIPLEKLGGAPGSLLLKLNRVTSRTKCANASCCRADCAASAWFWV